MCIYDAQNITFLILIVLASLFGLLYYSAISKQETTFNCNWEKVSEHKAPEGKDAHNKVHYAAHEHAANIIWIFATLSAMKHIARISRYVDRF